MDREDLKCSPHEMYMLAVRTGCRLPDDLHRIMILWGYDESVAEIAKGYFDLLEKREENRKSRMESERFDPLEMYLYSIRTGGRLPDELHGKMLLWSYDENHCGIVKNYLEWVEHCKKRDERKERLRKRIGGIERNERLLNLMVASGILLLAVLFAFKD